MTGRDLTALQSVQNSISEQGPDQAGRVAGEQHAVILSL
jgi:hypothetical protein